MRKDEYDFNTWTSFPSSIKLINDEKEGFAAFRPDMLTVKGGSMLRIMINAKWRDVLYLKSRVPVDGWDGMEWRRLLNLYLNGMGIKGWDTYSSEFRVPQDIEAVRLTLWGGGGTPGITWFDDLKIYQDDVLIYQNKFSEWKTVGAVVGAVIGGVAGGIYKPIGPIASPLLAALSGAGLGYGTGSVMMYRPSHSCPVCGSEVEDKPLGEDVLCGNCGFVSAWTR